MNHLADRTILRVHEQSGRRDGGSGDAIDSPSDDITRSNGCVLLIDHQIGPLWELEFGETRRRAVELAAAARGLGMPTIITAIQVDRLGPVIPELTAAFEEAPHIARTIVNAWDDTRIRDAIEKIGRKKLVIAGSAADVGVALCAKSALAAGFDVYVALDACAHISHTTATRLCRAGAILTTVSLIMNEIGAECAAG